MPRLTHSLLHRAARLSPHLPDLVRATRTLDDARTELRWLRAHAESVSPTASTSVSSLLAAYAHARGRLSTPLQYLLGTQPFGAAEILCRRGVLIPRAETEESASHLARLLKEHRPGVTNRVVDLCTGTGCIPLLLAAELERCKVLGVDISPRALRLAMRNRGHNAAVLKDGSEVVFLEADVLGEMPELMYLLLAVFDEIDSDLELEGVDVVVANPPYISPRGYERETARSVRLWEPKLALVPESGMEGDGFYPRIGRVARRLEAGCVVAEVGGLEQARRVQMYWEEIGWEGTSIWRDFAGRGRTVVGWRKGWEWTKNGPNESGNHVSKT